MKLTTFSDYALRVLIFAALEPEDGLTVSRIADAYGISQNHLMKVVQFLGQTGLLDTARGRGGGLTLARPAGEIRLGDVIRATEGDQRFIECVDKHGGSCCILPACTLPAVIHTAQQAFYDVLNQYTLDDIAQKRSRLTRLLDQA